MDKHKSNHLISVNSETGIYWNGERQLRTQAQVDAVINQKTADNYVTRGQTVLYFTAMKIIRAAASCLRGRCAIISECA